MCTVQYKMKLSAICITLIFAVCVTANKLQDSPSPSSEFITQPSNVTVPEGEQVLLKCMVASQAQVCRWYYLELGLKFFDKRITPMMVKEFSPAGRRDCSIKIKKVRKVQEGQWLCQALKFQSAKFVMSKPATVRVITESESATWEPPTDDSKSLPRNGRREDGNNFAKELGPRKEVVEFESHDDDVIQDVFVHETAVLKCQVNQPIKSCSWTMPNGATLTTSKDKEDSQEESEYPNDYRIQGDLSEGNCSMEIHEVGYHDEGNWRCVVRTWDMPNEAQGPLLHLHILDENTASAHTHDGKPLMDEEESSNLLVITLVTVSGMLFIIVLILLMFLYRRIRGNSDETQKILQNSPRNSIDLQRKMSPVTDFTAASVMAVEPRKKLPFIDQHFGHYNHYLDMTGSESSVGDGYIMMPGSSLRSSTSSRTTLSTISTLPIGSRSRSASNSTTSSGSFPHLTTIINNPSYNPDIAFHQTGLNRPDSVYSSDHLYEEIKEKIEEHGIMEKILEAESPTYTNIVEDCEGYMIPKKSPSTDLSKEQSDKKNISVHITQTPLPDPKNGTTNNTENAQISNTSNEQPPPYSRISSNNLVPIASPSTATSGLDPGYSRVGNNTESHSDPMERYDVPRPRTSTPMDNYDVPRQNPSPVHPQPNVSSPDETEEDGLTGIIV